MEDKLYCDQCGEEIKIGDDYIKTHHHIIHEDCEDDYIDMMKNDWDYKTYGEEE